MIYRYNGIAVGAKEASAYDTSSALQIGSSAENLEDDINNYDFASLEPNTYNVDNPRPIFNTTDYGLGFSTNALSGELGEFSSNIVLTISLDSLFSFQGILLNCDRQISYINIVTYRSGTEVANKTYNTVQTGNYFDIPSNNVNYIVITIYQIVETYRFLNIFGVTFGKIIDWTDDNAKDVKMVNQFSVSGRELPIDTLNFSIVDIDRDTIMTETNQKLEVIEEDTGKTKYQFYLDTCDWSDDNTKADLTFNDIASCLEDDFIGGIYNNATVKSIIDSILAGTNIVCEYGKIDNYNTTAVALVTGYIPKTTRRNALIYIANATGYKWLKQPNLKLIKRPDVMMVGFDDESIFSGTVKQTVKSPAKKVTLIKYAYSSRGTENQKIYNENITELGDYRVEFNNPMSSLSIKEVVTSGNDTTYIATEKATIVERNANYCIIRINTTCEIMLFGIPYIVSKTTLSKSVDNLNLYRNYTTENIDTFTLMTTYGNIINQMFDYYSKSESQKAKVLWSNPIIGSYVYLNGFFGNVAKITTSFGDSAEIEVE